MRGSRNITCHFLMLFLGQETLHVGRSPGVLGESFPLCARTDRLIHSIRDFARHTNPREATCYLLEASFACVLHARMFVARVWACLSRACS